MRLSVCGDSCGANSLCGQEGGILIFMYMCVHKHICMCVCKNS